MTLKSMNGHLSLANPDSDNLPTKTSIKSFISKGFFPTCKFFSVCETELHNISRHGAKERRKFFVDKSFETSYIEWKERNVQWKPADLEKFYWFCQKLVFIKKAFAGRDSVTAEKRWKVTWVMVCVNVFEWFSGVWQAPRPFEPSLQLRNCDSVAVYTRKFSRVELIWFILVHALHTKQTLSKIFIDIKPLPIKKLSLFNY